MTSVPCSPITGPITDTATYTYSDLDSGFTPPKSCLEPAYTSLPVGLDPVFTWAVTETAGNNVTSSLVWMKVYRGREPACYPLHYPNACEWRGTVQQQQNYVYSPATCPGGYASATTSIDQSATAMTTATCCPSGYALSTVRPNDGETFWGDLVSCTSVATSVVFKSTPTTFPSNVLTLYAPTVVVAWQSSDIARWRTALPTSTSGSSTSSSGSGAATKSGLSTGAKAGIGAGCALAAIAALVILLLFLRSRSRRRRAANHDVPITHEHQENQDNPEKSLPVKKKDPHVELTDEAALQEMTGHGRRNEADDKTARAELM